MFTHFIPPVILFLLVILIDIIFIVIRSKSLKTPIKIIRMGAAVLLVWVYGSAILGDASTFIRSGQGTAIGMAVLAIALILDTIVDFGTKA